MRRHAPESPVDGDHQAEASHQTDDRRERDELQRFDPLPAPHYCRQSRLRDRAAGVTADQSVRRARGQPEEPCNQVPCDGAEQSAEDDIGIDERDVDHSLTDRARDRRTHREQGNEVERRGPENGCKWIQDSGADDRRDRVRGIVKAVDKIEDERDEDNRDDVRNHAARCLTRSSEKCSGAPGRRPCSCRSRARACRTSLSISGRRAGPGARRTERQRLRGRSRPPLPPTS